MIGILLQQNLKGLKFHFNLTLKKHIRSWRNEGQVQNQEPGLFAQDGVCIADEKFWSVRDF